MLAEIALFQKEKLGPESKTWFQTNIHKSANVLNKASSQKRGEKKLKMLYIFIYKFANCIEKNTNNNLT